jgi:hypothetical protein
VVIQANQAWCFVTEQGKAVRKFVTVGVNNGTEVEITSGLSGDELVIAKSANLTDDQAVELGEPMPAR